LVCGQPQTTLLFGFKNFWWCARVFDHVWCDSKGRFWLVRPTLMMQRTVQGGLIQARLQLAQAARGTLAVSVRGEECKIAQPTWIRKSNEQAAVIRRRTFPAMENAKLCHVPGMDNSWTEGFEIRSDIDRVMCEQSSSQQEPAMLKEKIDSTRATLRRRQGAFYQEIEALLHEQPPPRSRRLSESNV
jgi:hypothetical protein